MNEIKTLPHSIEAERAVLGACLLEAGAFERAAEKLRPEMFYLDWHGLVFEIMDGIFQTSGAIDTVTVVRAIEARRLQQPTPYEITRLTLDVVNSMHLNAHADAIREAYTRRRLHALGSQLATDSLNLSNDPIELMGRIDAELSGLSVNGEETEPQLAETVSVEILRRQMTLRERTTPLIGTATGIKELDGHTLGWQAPDLIILAARPAVGKTAFALQLAKAAALDKHRPTPVAIFTLEMSAVQLTTRMLASASGIHMQELKAARLSDQQLEALYNSGVQPLAGKGIYIDDTAGLTVSRMKAKLRRLKKKGVGLVIVDYLQLMTPPTSERGTRNDQVGAISRGLKLAAKELNLPIIALSQMSRDYEKRGGGKPRLSDLRDAGGIEQDADSVLFLYGHKEEEIKANPELAKHRALTAAKHRNGGLFDLAFQFDGTRQTFTCQGNGDLPDLPPSFRPVNDSDFVSPF